MKDSPKSSLWERWADFTIRYDRVMLGVVLAITLFFAYFVFQLESNTSLNDFFRKESKELTETIEDDFQEGGYLTLIFESQTDQSLLTPAMLHQQFKVLQAIKKNYDVTTISLVDGIDEGLQRTRRKSILDIHEYTPIAEGILALSGPKTVRDLQRVSQHFLSHPEVISFYAKLRLAHRVSGTTGLGSSYGGQTAFGQSPGTFGVGGMTASRQAQKMTFSVPYVKAIQSYLKLNRDYTATEQHQVFVAIRELADSLATPELKAYCLNGELVAYDIDIQSRQNALFMGLILVVVDSLLLWGIFRSRREVFLTLFIMLTACIWTFGAANLAGIRLSFLHLIVLPILLGTGIDDSVVFGRRLAEERTKHQDLGRALRSTFAATGKGIFLTTFTTFLAFLCGALVTTAPVILSFYLLVSFSMVVVFLLSIILQGSIHSLLARRGSASAIGTPVDKRVAPTHPVLNTLTVFSAWRWITTRPRTVLLVSALLFLAALGAGSGLETDFDRKTFIRKGMPTYSTSMVQDKYFGRNHQGYILFEGAVANPLLLKKMRLLEERMNHYPLIQKVLGRANVESVNELIDKMRLHITPQTLVSSVFDKITGSERTANFVFDQSYGEAADYLVHKKGDHYDALLMEFFMTGTEQGKIWKLYESLQQEVQTLGLNEIPGVKTRIGGGDFSYFIDTHYYFGNFVRSFFLSLAISGLTLIIVWRKFWQSVLATIPIVFSVVLTLGLMSLSGVKLTNLTVCIGSIVVGLGIDYPIHVIERFNEERRGRVIQPLQAIQNALSTMGPVLFGSALTTIAGFGAACVLAMPIAESFGIFTAVAILFAYLGSIFVLPVLLLGWRR